MVISKKFDVLSDVLMAVAVVFLFKSHLMLTVISGLTFFMATFGVYRVLEGRLHAHWVKKVTLALLVGIVGLVLTGAGFGLYMALHAGQQNVEALAQEVVKILQQLRVYLPEGLWSYFPEDWLSLKEKLLGVLEHQSGQLLNASVASFTALAHVFLGFFIGGFVAFDVLDENKPSQRSTFWGELRLRIKTFAGVFSKVMGAQVKISLVNTVLTGVFLLVIMPLLGMKLPYGKTLVVLTFLCGLLPVVGNLISNTLITVIALTVGSKAAVCVLVFLVVVHKLEYYINAKIVGKEIGTKIWELLIAMFVFKALFGILGLVLAPVLYGYVKEELKQKQWISD
jgi:predicted PurR-regulated permease PerM